MNTSKYIILLSLMLLFPLFAVGQRLKPVTKREAEQIGKKTYKVTTGEVTKVVNTVGSGLDDEYSKFLFRSGNGEADSIFSDINSNYNSLEEAALDIDQLLQEVERERKVNNENNESLAFWIAKKNRDRRKVEKEAQTLAKQIVQKEQEPTVEELALKYVKFGDKPTYYINGLEVPQSIAVQLYPSEVVKRDIIATETASGNPNGEIWYTVTDRALNRIKIPTEQAYEYIYGGEPIAPAVSPTPKVSSAPSTETKELKTVLKEKKKVDLKPLPVVKREKTEDGKYNDVVIQKSKKQQKPAKEVIPQQNIIDVQEEKEQVATPASAPVSVPAATTTTPATTSAPAATENNPFRTRVVSRTVNNQRVNVEEPVESSGTVTTTAPVQRSIPVVRKSEQNSEPVQQQATPVQKVKKQETKVEKKKVEPSSKKPKRSVRAIKEREQSQYDEVEVE